MNRKVLRQIGTVIIVSAIPAFLSYMANSTLIFDKLISYGLIGESINIPLIQDYCLWISIAFSAFFLSLNLVVTKVKHDRIVDQRNKLIKMNKKVLSSALGKRFLSEPSAFDIRIFVPKYPTLYKVSDKMRIFKIPKKFIIKNIDLISDQGITKDLQFEVHPHEEGLVGMCYNTKSMVYDDDLQNTNDKIYQLNQTQIDRTSNLKWSICCPICDKGDNVVAIIAVDGKTRITIDDDKASTLKEELPAFSYMLYDSVPQLFKRR